MAIAMLSKGIDSTEAQLEAAFCMFDADKSGELTREEFDAMVHATVNLNLDHLLVTDHGAAAFEAQLTKEYSEENLAFWQAVRAYREIEDGAERLAKEKELEEEFVTEGSMRQVNLPSGIYSTLVKALKDCITEAPPDVFDAASEEIFKLMERDTFARFKNDPEASDRLVEACV